MKKKVSLGVPIGKLTRVDDFLPSPKELMASEEKVKVTLYLKKSNVEMLKNTAKQSHTKYQRIVRELVDRYVEHYSHVSG